MHLSLGSKRQAVRTVVDNLDGTVHFEPATLWPVTPSKPPTGKIGDKLTVYDRRVPPSSRSPSRG